MIYVTQGHQNGVGLEVFLKASLCFGQNFLNQLILITYKDSLLKTLETLGLEFKLSQNNLSFSGLKIRLQILSPTEASESTGSLEYALSHIQPTDILLTLPTSKDQLDLNGKKLNGYTEFFRKYFNNSDITMNFLAPSQNVLLLTDHISIDIVSKRLTKENILNKVEITLENLGKLRVIKDVYFSGIDPHCGESGQISTHDSVFDAIVLELQKRHSNISFQGPFAADTLHLKYEDRSNQLFVYAYHDQGLAPFKLKNGLVGINLTLGLPFIRISVDHGTAFDLFGKNSANYQGMLYLLKEIQKWT